MNKRVKALFSLILCMILLVSVALPAYAEEQEETVSYEIGTAEALLELAEKCRLDSFSENLVVTLTADIDLSGTEFAGFPIFSGSFDGKGHTISGFSLICDGSYLGLFRYLTGTAVVQNLHVKGTLQPGASRSYIGGIAGSNAGQILNCTFSGTVSAGESVGGLVGINTLAGIIENCRSEGSVVGNHFVGGIAGENSGVIRSCINAAQVNTTAQQNTVNISDITLDTLVGTESAQTVTDIGGIAGMSTGVIRDSENRADVGYRHMGYNIGGIAGTQSGYIVNCENTGRISGRKEVGGIVGQMEPMALVEYDEDALQILEAQLKSMGQITSKTAANVDSATSELTAQVESIKTDIQEAKDAVNTLLPSEENPIPDLDTIQAAQNTLSNSLTDMNQTLHGMSATTESAMGTLSNNLHSLQNQISAMSATLGNVSKTLGGSITDVSDLDTELDLTGKVEGCINYGAVLADRNAGGIAGAIALENDLDPEDDLTITGESSLNFESELRAVILRCENRAEVSGSKQSIGGIVGWMSMGLTKACLNTGAVTAEGAEGVGGIVGTSTGYVRANSAKCRITGSSCVGGIAGSGTIVTDCRSMVSLDADSEKLGAVLGTEEESTTEEEAPISGNFYVSVDGDLGGIDGISYAGRAEALTRTEFLALEELSDAFQTVTLSFLYEDGNRKTVTVATGGAIADSQIPKLPTKAGYSGNWEGLEALNLDYVTFDAVITASYTPLATTIASGAAQGAMPVLLLQGTFPEEAAVSLAESTDVPALEAGQTLLDARTFGISENGTITTARFLLPEDCDTERLMVLVRGSAGDWREAETAVEGSYIVFGLEEGENRFALIETAAPVWPLMAAGAAVMILAAVVLVILRSKKKKAKKQTETE